MPWLIRFTVPGDCVPQPRHRIGKVLKGRRAGRPVAYLPEEHPVHAFKQDVAIRAREAVRDCEGFPVLPIHAPLRLRSLFVLPKQKKHKGGGWHYQKPDLDNLVKSVKDAMTGIVYEDDGLVAHEELIKVYDDGILLPRLEVVVCPAGDVAEAVASFRGFKG